MHFAPELIRLRDQAHKKMGILLTDAELAGAQRHPNGGGYLVAREGQKFPKVSRDARIEGLVFGENVELNGRTEVGPGAIVGPHTRTVENARVSILGESVVWGYANEGDIEAHHASLGTGRIMGGSTFYAGVLRNGGEVQDGAAVHEGIVDKGLVAGAGTSLGRNSIVADGGQLLNGARAYNRAEIRGPRSIATGPHTDIEESTLLTTRGGAGTRVELAPLVRKGAPERQRIVRSLLRDQGDVRGPIFANRPVRHDAVHYIQVMAGNMERASSAVPRPGGQDGLVR